MLETKVEILRINYIKPNVRNTYHKYLQILHDGYEVMNNVLNIGIIL